MKEFKITNSSAIRNVKFKENNIVSIKFTSNDQEYDFKARDQEAYDYVTQGVEKTYAKKESMGKFINAMRSSDRLVEIDI